MQFLLEESQSRQSTGAKQLTSGGAAIPNLAAACQEYKKALLEESGRNCPVGMGVRSQEKERDWNSWDKVRYYTEG